MQKLKIKENIIMQIKLGTGNRITLPKDICNQLNLEIGQQLELEIVLIKLKNQ